MLIDMACVLICMAWFTASQVFAAGGRPSGSSRSHIMHSPSMTCMTSRWSSFCPDGTAPSRKAPTCRGLSRQPRETPVSLGIFRRTRGSIEMEPWCCVRPRSRRLKDAPRRASRVWSIRSRSCGICTGPIGRPGGRLLSFGWLLDPRGIRFYWLLPERPIEHGSVWTGCRASGRLEGAACQGSGETATGRLC